MRPSFILFFFFFQGVLDWPKEKKKNFFFFFLVSFSFLLPKMTWIGRRVTQQMV
jgi:hypothetical protein